MSGKLLWVDLEMTGLRPLKDKIVEVAAIVTDFNFNEIAAYESGVKHPEKLLRKLTGESVWHQAQPAYTEKMIQASLNGKTSRVVQTELIRLVQQHIGLSQEPESYPHFPGSLEARGEVYLAGNSIGTDRAFIDAQWHDFARILHYRMLDVSAFKLWMLEKKGLEKHIKKTNHRALEDIRESISEMKYYAEHM